MLYTSGTTARPKGVPRRQRAERAAALAHVAQNIYGNGERTLGVMPLYHTMGVRSLLAMSLIGGAFVCLPRFDVGPGARADRAPRRSPISTWCRRSIMTLVASRGVCKDRRALACASSALPARSMTDGLLKELQAAFKPELFVNHYGSSEIYTFTIDQNAPAKPGSAGRPASTSCVRVVKLGAHRRTRSPRPAKKARSLRYLAGDESFEGYWRRPEADAKALRDGWYFTGDTGYFDADGDLFVTGRVDDMIITGGENVSPVEIESCLSLHPGVSEVAVVGLADERWGKIVAAFVKRSTPVNDAELDQYLPRIRAWPISSDRAATSSSNDIPKSPVGKLLAPQAGGG